MIPARRLFTGAAVALLAGFIWLVLSPDFPQSGGPLVSLVLPVMNVQKAIARAGNISRTFLPAIHQQSPPFISPSSARTFTSTSATMTHTTTAFKEAIQHRRTIYQLTKKSPISDSKIREILTLAIEDVPSSFNSQTTRLVALFHKDHDRFWDVVESKLKPIVESQGGDFSSTAARIKGFRDAYATVLFYEDTEIVQGLQKNMPLYADKFPQWSEHTAAMHQYMLWTAFETEGLGCNLQHYNPLPDKDIQEIWKVPANWSLTAQLVIGQPAEGAREQLGERKQTKPVEERLFVHGA